MAEPRRERKVVTVLFADLVGFTSRAEQLDPEDVDAELSRYHAHVRTELERHGGTVEKFIGDAAMAVFGAPVAHEDDAERAVRAALAIRDWAREQDLEVRVGVNTGEALVKLGARPEAGEGMASGDVVNTAARLQAAAPANGILVGEQTYRATRQAIDYRDQEPVEAKGKAEPVPAWEAVEARSRFGVDVEQAPQTALVGRERELGLLREAFERALEQREPQLVTLVGVPGIGKSRLVYELAEVVERDPRLVTWRQGRSLPYGDGVTFWALGEIVKAQAGILETDGVDEAEAKLRRTIADLLADEAEAAWVRARLEPLLGLGEGELGGDRRAESFSAWRRFVEALAESRPLVLVFDDLQWADEDLLDFVDYLVDWSGGVPLLVVCTARPELLQRRSAWGGGKPNALTVSLSPLTDEETARLIGQLLGRSVLEAAQQGALLDRAGGNPLYAEQFARMLAERGEVERVPETVQGIIAARLDALPVEEKTLLQDAAVLGKVFWLGALASVGDRDPSETEAWLHALERKEFVRRERRSSVAGERELAFRHLLVRDVAYGQIPRADRAERHRRAAEWIESLGRPDDNAELVAHHYLAALELTRAAGGDAAGLEAAARSAFRQAGDRALALGALPTARRLYEAALELWPGDDPGGPDLLYRYARSRVDDPEFDEALLQEAVDGFLEAGNRGAAAECEALLTFIWWPRGENDRVLEHLQRAVELVATEPPSRAKAFVLTQVSRISMLAGEDERAIEVGVEALRMAEHLGLEELRARNLNTVGASRLDTGDVGGLADLDRAVEVGRAVNSQEEWQAALNRAWLTAMVGDVQRAWELHLESTAIAERFAHPAHVRWEQAERVAYAYWRGEWDDCLARMDDFLAWVASTGGSHYMEGPVLAERARIRLARGDVDGALADSGQALESVRRAKDPQIRDPILAIRARLLVEVGRPAEAAPLLDELLASWARRVHPTEAPLEAAWALRALARGNELAPALEAARLRTRWLEAALLVAAGDLVAAADLLAEIGSLPDEAYARLRAGGEHAGRALAFYRSVGATRYVREAESLLAASA